MIGNVPETIENIVGKGENTFSSFFSMSSKSKVFFSSGLAKSLDYLVTG